MTPIPCTYEYRLGVAHFSSQCLQHTYFCYFFFIPNYCFFLFAFFLGAYVSTQTRNLPVLEMGSPFPVLVPVPEVQNPISGTALTIHFLCFLARAPVQSRAAWQHSGQIYHNRERSNSALFFRALFYSTKRARHPLPLICNGFCYLAWEGYLSRQCVPVRIALRNGIPPIDV